MPYSVELHFDRESAERIRRVRVAVAEQLGAGVSSELEARPHVSLAVLHDVDPAVLAGVVGPWAVKSRGFAMALSAVGVFPSDAGVIFLAPALSRELLEMHDVLYKTLCAAGLSVDDYYVPGKWLPHCTICMKAPRDRTGGIVDFLRQFAVFGPVRVQSVSVVDFSPAREVRAFPLAE
jgi:2'-5' RNA ligase